MKKLLLLLLLIVLPKSVFAENCSVEDETLLKIKVNSVSLKYEHPGNNIFDLVFENLEDGYYIEELSKEIILRKGVLDKAVGYVGGDNYNFNYFGDENSMCPGVLLRVQSVPIPKYNSFSEESECEEYPNFDLCDKWYPGEINQSSFKSQLESYIIKQNRIELEPEIVIENEESFFDIIMDKIARFFIPKNLLIIFGTIFLSGIIWLIIILKRKKSNRI